MVKRGLALLSLFGILVLLVAFSGCVGKKETYLFSANLDSGAFVGIKNVIISNQVVYLDEKGRETAKLSPNGTVYYVFDAVFSNPTKNAIQMPSTGLGALSESGDVYLAEPPRLTEDLQFNKGILASKESVSGKVRVPFSQSNSLKAFVYDSFGKEKRFELSRSEMRFDSAILILSPIFEYVWLEDGVVQTNFTFSLGNTIPLRGDWNLHTDIYDVSGKKVDSNLLVTLKLPANNSVRSSSTFELSSGKYFATFTLIDLATNTTFSNGMKYEVGA